MMEGNNDESNNFKMDILDKFALYKALEGRDKLQTKNSRETIYQVIDDEYFKQPDVELPNEFLLKYKQEFNVSNFIPVDFKKAIQKIGLEYGLLSQIVKIKRTIIGETGTDSKIKIEQKNQYLNLKVSRHYQIHILLLKTTSLKKVKTR